MAQKYDIELSNKSVQIQLKFISDAEKVIDPIIIDFEITTVTSSEFDFEQRMQSKYQRYLVKTFIISQKNKELITESGVINSNKYKIAPIPLPKIPNYEIDYSKLKSIAVESNKNGNFLHGQYLWLSQDPNSNISELGEDNLPIYITPNSQITIPLKKKSADQAIHEVAGKEKKIKVFENIVFLPKTERDPNKQWFKTVDSFTTFENNLFYLCFAQFHNKSSSDILEFSSRQIKNLIHFQHHDSNAVFLKRIDKAFRKFLDLKVEIVYQDPETGESVKSLQQFFTRCDVYVDSLKVKIQYAPVFETLINELNEYTKFSLLDYVRIRSNYSKAIYRALKSFRAEGQVTFYVEPFKKLLGLKKDYKVANINRRIIKTAMIDLAPYFHYLNVKKHYVREGRSTKISGWTFSWTEESNHKQAITNRLLDETEAIYNIKTNHYLSHDQKLESLDKYRGQKIGTAKKMYEHAHPNSYFFVGKEDIKNKRSSSNQFVRIDLSEAFDYPLKNLAQLIKVYEKINYEGMLNKGDVDDLALLEELYVQRQLPKALKTAGHSHPNFPDRSIIAGQAIHEILFFDSKKGLVSLENEVRDKMDYIKKVAADRVREQFGSKAKFEDNRDPAVKM